MSASSSFSCTPIVWGRARGGGCAAFELTRRTHKYRCVTWLVTKQSEPPPKIPKMSSSTPEKREEFCLSLVDLLVGGQLSVINGAPTRIWVLYAWADIADLDGRLALQDWIRVSIHVVIARVCHALWSSVSIHVGNVSVMACGVWWLPRGGHGYRFL